MWALRRTAIPSRCLVHCGVGQTICLERDILVNNIECIKQQQRKNSVPRGNIIRFHELFDSAKSNDWSRNLSSISEARSSDNLEDTVSNLEICEADESSDNDIFEEVVNETADGVLVPSGPQKESNGQKRKREASNSSPLFEMLMETARKSIHGSLNQWIKEGKPLGKSEVDGAIHDLRRRKIFGKALELIEWLEKTKHIDFTESLYASYVDLIAKVYGIQKAEKYVDQLPEPFKNHFVYNTLLVNCVSTDDVKKSEEIFSKIRKLGPLTSFPCSQLLLLYKRDPKKISEILQLMQKEDVKHTHFTYKILMDIKGRVKDIQGMEDIVSTMNSEGIDVTTGTKAMIAKYFMLAKQNDKAEALLKEIEGDDINENHDVICTLLPLYALLGKADEVSRIWKVCEANPTIEECSAAIEAWGQLGKIENAENLFEYMLKTWKKLSPRFYNTLLKVYADHKLTSKVKDFIKRMSENKCVIGPLTWDLLVKIFAEAGEVEKADSILSKAMQNIPDGLRMKSKPLYTTYIVLLDSYAKRGDVPNAEKIFDKMRRDKYVGVTRMYNTLLKAYIKAKMPAYGIRERMKADNVVLNLPLKRQLEEVDNFAKVKNSCFFE